MIAHEARENTINVGVLWQLVDSILIATLVDTLLYGIHLVLFCICTYFLIRKGSRAGVIILLSVTIMLALATADVVLTFYVMVDDLPAMLRFGIAPDLFGHLRSKNTLFVTDNLIADGLLLYRCYMIWNGHKFDKIIALVVSVLLAADTIWGYLAAETNGLDFQQVITPLYLWSVFAFNIAITAVTAGRIWWLARLSRPILGEQSVRSYNIVIAILIESGAIYSISVMLLVILWNKPYTTVMYTVVYRIVGIVPTLMIVQIELGTRRGHKPNSHSVEMTTNPMFTTVAASATSTQVFNEGLDSDIEDHPRANRDTKATFSLPMRNTDPPGRSV